MSPPDMDVHVAEAALQVGNLDQFLVNCLRFDYQIPKMLH
jgi:hypothetical protein